MSQTVTSPVPRPVADVIEWMPVDERPEPERVEIELTANAPEHDRWRTRSPAASAVAPDQTAEPASGDTITTGPNSARLDNPSDQRRVVGTAAIVGVVALLLGWLIGRSGGSDEVATTSVTAPVTTERVRTPLLPGETLPSASTTTTRPPRTTTTTTLAAPEKQLADIDPRLAGLDLTLVAIEQQRFIIELDVGNSTLVRRDMGRLGADPGTMIAGDGWITVAGTNDGRTLLIRDDGTTQRVLLGEPWQLLWQPGTDRFWRPLQNIPYGSGARYDEVDLDGEPTGAVIELPVGAWSWQIDPLGGLIVQATGKLYRVDVSGVSAIGSGDLIGLSSGVALIRDCDEQLRCGLTVTDRTTGDHRRLETSDADGEPVSVESLYGWGSGGVSSIAPDGSMAGVMLQSNIGPPVLSLVDLVSGAVVELGSISYMPTLTWSPDSRFAFFLQGPDDFAGYNGLDLKAYDRESGEVFTVFSDPVKWEAMAARPRSG